MSPSLLLTPCTGHSVCLPLPRHCTASCPLKWDGALHWVMQLHSPGLWLVTWPQYWSLIGWWRRQQGKEGPGRVEEGRLVICLLGQNTRPHYWQHTTLILSSEKNWRISVYFATFLLKYKRSNVSVNVHLIILFWNFILPHFFNPPPVIRERDMFALCQQCSSSISPFVLLHFAVIPVI